MVSKLNVKSFPLFYLILIFVVIILIAVNIFLLSLIFKDPISVKNESDQVKVQMENTDQVLTFANPIDEPDKIKSVTLVVKDEKIKAVNPGVRYIPFRLDPAKVVSDNGTFTINLGVDKEKLNDFSEDEYNEILNNVILMYLLSVTKPELNIQERGAEAARLVDNHKKSHTLPFTLDKL